MASGWTKVKKRYWIPAAALLALALILAATHAFSGNMRAARRRQNAEFMREIVVALENFNLAYDHLPPAAIKDKAGRPMCSWRFWMHPYLSAWMVDWTVSEPWDSPRNRFFAKLRHRAFCWSSKHGTLRDYQPSEDAKPEEYFTNVVAITAPGTPFGQDQPSRFQELPGNVILLVEIAHSGIHWMAPGDLSIDNVPESIVRGTEGDGFFVAFADRRVWFLSSDVPLDVVKRFFTIEGAKKADREKLLGPYAVYLYGPGPS